MAEQTPHDLLVGLLHEAAELEHCLLDSYLYAACSLKTHPEEFATLVGGRENRRRAIQFERVRAWKQAIIGVAAEEMGHLNYVQCMIRALGEPPHFGLPERDPDSGSWLFRGWRTRIGSEESDDGTEVPIEPLTPGSARRFVLYEATDALQDADPFGSDSMELFGDLHAFELDLLFETALLDVEDDTERERLKKQLAELYEELLPADPVPEQEIAHMAVPGPIDIGKVQFQSIADLYNKAILPLYQEAFHFNRVPYSNLDLNAELQEPAFAGEGFLPVLPMRRDRNFDDQAHANVKAPLKNFRAVADVIAEIVEEGEGLQGFEAGARALLAKVAKLGGSRAYLKAQLADERPNAPPTPPWLAEAQRVRCSHLYRFAMTLVELELERDLAKRAGVEFEPARSPLARSCDAGIDRLATSAPAHFNACYLALLAWLSRIYEIRTWASDRRRRLGIEMLASWPMMSLAIRPFLELMSFLPIERTQIFRLDDDSLPNVPVNARQLLRLYLAGERTQEINDRMDYYGVRALSDVARWAGEQRDALTDADIDPLAKRMILNRLGALAGLDEFERQFPYREHGGYSARMPDQQYQIAHPDSQRYEEAPQEELFKDTLVLRLRFAGRGLVQLATDPDPPTDEVGATGTHMLHAAESDHSFDRALVWQPSGDTDAIVREPRDQLPPLGVRAAEIALMVTNGRASAGYVPIAALQSTGAVQTSGVQQRAEVQGLNPILELAPPDVGSGVGVRVNLLPSNGRRPFLNGFNHLVWTDGEPIDPFIMAVLVDDPVGGPPLEMMRREVFNEGLTFMQMDPLQRLLSSRAPSGFDFNIADIPAWARPMLSEEERRQLEDPEFPRSYLRARARVLRKALQVSLATGERTRAGVDQVVSFAERMRLVVVPAGTTSFWLTILLNYGHTVSGTLASAPDGPVLEALRQRLGAKLAISDAQRGQPNGRWMVTYVKGFMDTDALSDVVYGELYVPLTVQPSDEPVRFGRSWRFVPGMTEVVASYACRFTHPFWADFKVDGDTRTIKLPNGTTIVETLTRQADIEYAYSASGVAGIADYAGSFAVSASDEATELSWTVTFTAADAASLTHMLTICAAAATSMSAKLDAHFSPTG
jgi:hypothetical protein